ncbi:tektin-2 [Phlebotomus argentipes]|uniref:tektin-2 n=1 Tax=Phlebotomus argentipes TaxID=94469 RepID=UPI002892A6F6|nr:tektin-2 [Phlebotomus argentipes]
MASKSVVVSEKPVKHVGLSDWQARLNEARSVATARRNDAFEVRHAARNLRNETDIQSKWDCYHNTRRLESRVEEVNQWRESLEECLSRVEREIDILRAEKAQTERELEALATPLTVVSECLATRDSRWEIEMTYDEAEKLLKLELSLVEKNQIMLRDQCQSAWEKLNALEDVRFQLNLEICNKKEAEGIDIEQMHLNKFSANTTFKSNPQRIPKESCTHEGWLTNTKNVKSLAENELKDTYALRESLFVTREKTRNELHAQQDLVDHTIRRRIFETQRARNELKWQIGKTEEEMNLCLVEIEALEKAIEDKKEVLKLAESRQESRFARSGFELCRDEPFQGLCGEISQLRDTLNTLTNQLNVVKGNYSVLEDQHCRLTRDLENKEHSLMVEVRTLDQRERLKSWQGKECRSQTGRNIRLTGLEHEIPKSSYI